MTWYERIKGIWKRKWVQYDGNLLFSTWKNFKVGDVFVKYYKYLYNGQVVNTRKAFRVKKIHDYNSIIIYIVEEV